MSSQKEQPKVDLYDYIYKDTERLNSFYSQLFKGIVNNYTHSNSGMNLSESSGAGKLGFTNNNVSSNFKMQESNTNGSDTTVSPHDYSVSLLIEYLFDNNYIAPDFESAPNNSLVLLRGSINIIEKFYAENIINDYEELINKESDIEQTTKELSMKGISNFRRFDFDNYFIFSAQRFEVGGFIPNEYLCDKISTISLSGGGFDTQDLNMIAIKHIPKNSLSGLPLKHIEHQQGFNSALKGLLFGTEIKYILTPIVIFRKLK